MVGGVGGKRLKVDRFPLLVLDIYYTQTQAHIRRKEKERNPGDNQDG